jgi:hypothetical protein
MNKHVDFYWNGCKNVCAGCNKPYMTIHIVTGHDHTDDVFRLCDCGNGTEMSIHYNKIKNTTYPYSHYLEYETCIIERN